MSLQETRDRLAAGWPPDEAVLGRDWRENYPNIAAWPGGYVLSTKGGLLSVSLRMSYGSDHPGFHTTIYTLVTKTILYAQREDKYKLLDGFIQKWREEKGEKFVAEARQRWMGKFDWQDEFPTLGFWISRGKRHCIRVGIDYPNLRSKVKAWHYDKASNTETVLVEAEYESIEVEAVIRALDKGIARWLEGHHCP